MNIEIIFFGQLSELTGCSSIKMDNPGSISILKELLFSQYSGLEKSKYFIALNNKMVLEDGTIPDNSTIAFMPPFSGG